MATGYPDAQIHRCGVKITQAFVFEAAHRLPNVPDGHKCKNMHGHSYRVELTYVGDIDPHTGFVLDFFDIERQLKPLFAQLDHKVLNEVPGLGNPTAENIAIWISRKTDAYSVRVYETPMCWAEA